MSKTPSRFPKIGRIVHYKLSAIDINAILSHRGKTWKHGTELLVGDVLPMIITKVHGQPPDTFVSGKVFLDGTDDYWAVLVQEGSDLGMYQWPTISD